MALSALARAAAMAVVAAAVAAGAVSMPAEAAADDHETVGGGTFKVSNSSAPCTDFEAAGIPLQVCAGQSIAIPFTKYIIVPLGNAVWVACETYTPYGQLFEQDEEHLSEVPRKQQFWNERGWGVYTPQAMCQMW